MSRPYRVEKWTGRGTPSAAELKVIMEKEGFSVYEWSDSPGATYSAHTHSDDQSHWVVSGTLELNVSGYGVVKLSPGDRDFMPGGTEHAAKVIGDEPVVYLIGSK
jgi:quercetin dioxygenase-like cupin family protein